MSKEKGRTSEQTDKTTTSESFGRTETTETASGQTLTTTAPGLIEGGSTVVSSSKDSDSE